MLIVAHRSFSSILLPAVCLLAVGALPARGQQLASFLFDQFAVAQTISCDDFNQCTTGGTCQPDGTCRGTNAPNGTGCNDQNPCTTNDRCTSGVCGGTAVAAGTPCEDFLGACTVNDRCQGFGDFLFCFGDPKDCPDDGNECTFDCNPQTGQCEHIAFPDYCDDECSTGECNPATGECVNVQNRPDGTTCDDFNECTSNDRCAAGECVGSGGPTTPQATFTPTATPPAQQPSATPTRNLTPPTLGPCVGDCNDSGSVTVDELVRGVNIALGNTPVTECPAFDPGNDGQVTVDELVKGVNAALNGCTKQTPGAPTQTPIAGTTTPTSGAASPTRTATTQASVTATSGGAPTHSPTTAPTGAPGEPSIPRRASGTVEATASSLLKMPSLFSTLLSRTGSLAGVGSGGIAVPFDCPDGGQVSIDCNQDIIIFPPSFGPPEYSLALSSCMLTTSAAEQITLDGTLTATGQDSGDFCFVDVPNDMSLGIPTLSVTTQGAALTTIATFSDVSGSLDFGGDDPACKYSTYDLRLTGTLGIETKDGDGETLSMTETSFSNTSLFIEVEEYGDECFPKIYSVTVNGAMTLSTGGNTFAGTYSTYRVHNDASSGNNLVTVSGGVTSECFGGAVQLSTPQVLIVPAGDPCPSAGEVLVQHGVNSDLLRYTAEGGVEVDTGNNGSVDETFPSCLDPRLFVCPAS